MPTVVLSYEKLPVMASPTATTGSIGVEVTIPDQSTVTIAALVVVLRMRESAAAPKDFCISQVLLLFVIYCCVAIIVGQLLRQLLICH